jgi:hypothetical protein
MSTKLMQPFSFIFMAFDEVSKSEYFYPLYFEQLTTSENIFVMCWSHKVWIPFGIIIYKMIDVLCQFVMKNCLYFDTSVKWFSLITVSDLVQCYLVIWTSLWSISTFSQKTFCVFYNFTAKKLDINHTSENRESIFLKTLLSVDL